ncbi:hypothetical protein ACFLUV_05535 [Elusimicrobiota bacterium]
MNDSIKNRIIFFLVAFILVLNLFFKAGWDIWVQTLVHIISIFIIWSGFCLSYRISETVRSLPFLLLASGLIISRLFTHTPAVSDADFHNYLNYILIFLTAATFFSSDKYRDNAINLILYAGILSSLLDFIYPLVFKTSLYPNPNMKIGFLLLVFPVFIYKTRQYFLNKNSTFFTLTLAGLILVLFSFFQARSGWGAMVLIFSVLFYLYAANLWKIDLKWMILILMAAVIVFILIKPDRLLARLVWMKCGLCMFAQQPLAGWGAGSTPHILPAFMSGKYFSLYIHSFFIQFLAENGLIAFSGLIWLIAVILIRIFKSGTDDRNKAVFISLSAVLAYNIFEYNLAIPLIGMAFWFTAGCFTEQKNISFSFNTKTKNAAFSILCLIILIFISIKITVPFRVSRYFAKGMYSIKTKDYITAENLFNSSLNIQPEYPLSRIGLAIISLRKNELSDAAENIRAALPPVKNGPAYSAYLKGIFYLDNENNSYAEIEFIKAVKYIFTQHGLDYREYT